MEYDPSYWHDQPEAKAVTRAKREYGSVLGAYEHFIVRSGGYAVEESRRKPGDIIEIHGDMEIGGRPISLPRSMHVAFVANSYELWSWTKLGLERVSGGLSTGRRFTWQQL